MDSVRCCCWSVFVVVWVVFVDVGVYCCVVAFIVVWLCVLVLVCVWHRCSIRACCGWLAFVVVG